MILTHEQHFKASAYEACDHMRMPLHTPKIL